MVKPHFQLIFTDQWSYFFFPLVVLLYSYFYFLIIIFFFFFPSVVLLYTDQWSYYIFQLILPISLFSSLFLPIISSLFLPPSTFNRSCSGRVDRASAPEAVDSGSNTGRVKPKTIKIGIHSFPA